MAGATNNNGNNQLLMHLDMQDMTISKLFVSSGSRTRPDVILCYKETELDFAGRLPGFLRRLEVGRGVENERG